jgi:hypothetical protein
MEYSHQSAGCGKYVECSDWVHSLGKGEVGGGCSCEERESVVMLDWKTLIVRWQM